MYQLFCDGALLYDLRNPDYALADLKCELEANKTGSLSFRIAPTHPMYSSIQKMKSEIALYQDGEWLGCMLLEAPFADRADMESIEDLEALR